MTSTLTSPQTSDDCSSYSRCEHAHEALDSCFVIIVQQLTELVSPGCSACSFNIDHSFPAKVAFRTRIDGIAGHRQSFSYGRAAYARELASVAMKLKPPPDGSLSRAKSDPLELLPELNQHSVLP